MIEIVDKIKQLMREADDECIRLGKEETRIGYKSYLKEYNYNKGKRYAYTNVLKMIGALEEAKAELPQISSIECQDCELRDTCSAKEAFSAGCLERKRKGEVK
jgi:hypothetical protein